MAKTVGSAQWISEYKDLTAQLFILEPLSAFKSYIEQAKAASKDLDERGRKMYLQDGSMLADHEELMRSINGYMAALEGGLVPGLMSHDENMTLRGWAAESVGYIDANLKALRYRLEKAEEVPLPS